MNRIFARIFRALQKNHERYRLRAIKSLDNVDIDPSFDLGLHSYIHVPESRCVRVNIARMVSTRMFCNFLVYPTGSLIIHENVFFNNYCSVNCLGNTEIGANTLFGEAVKLYDHNHIHTIENNQLLVERTQFKTGFIKIGRNCWIGSNVTILNNVEIGDNVIIGANNLIYKSIPSNQIIKAKADYTFTDRDEIS